MVQKLLVALCIAVVLFLSYRLARAYWPSLFGGGRKIRPTPIVQAPIEPFVAEQKIPIAGPPPMMPPAPAPAPEITAEPPQPERTVSPGGPNSPNAAAPEERPPTLSPDAKPIDPYDNTNMEAPIHDSMRHPELSFGPGVDNRQFNKVATAGTGSAAALVAESTFSPEFAQNGGSFMGSVFANDLSKDDRFAPA